MSKWAVAFRINLVWTAAALLLAAAATAAWTNSWTVAPRAPVLPPPSRTVQSGHLAFGPVRPARSLPSTPVLLDSGETRELRSLVAGHWTLVQLIFTGCSTTCPIQGAIFAKTQLDFMAAGLDAQFLSISIDPLGDDANSMTKWLESFGGHPGWRAVVLPFEGLGPLLDVLGGRGKGVDVHDARVYLVDPHGNLRYVTEELPNPLSLLNLVKAAQADSVATTQ
jgi:protein SCO1/2